MTPAKTPVTLASRSAVRAQLLSAAGVVFETTSTDVDEEAVKTDLLTRGAFPPEIAAVLADAKALAAPRPGVVVPGTVTGCPAPRRRSRRT